MQRGPKIEQKLKGEFTEVYLIISPLKDSKDITEKYVQDLIKNPRLANELLDSIVYASESDCQKKLVTMALSNKALLTIKVPTRYVEQISAGGYGEPSEYRMHLYQIKPTDISKIHFSLSERKPNSEYLNKKAKKIDEGEYVLTNPLLQKEPKEEKIKVAEKEQPRPVLTNRELALKTLEAIDFTYHKEKKMQGDEGKERYKRYIELKKKLNETTEVSSIIDKLGEFYLKEYNEKSSKFLSSLSFKISEGGELLRAIRHYFTELINKLSSENTALKEKYAEVINATSAQMFADSLKKALEPQTKVSKKEEVLPPQVAGSAIDRDVSERRSDLQQRADDIRKKLGEIRAFGADYVFITAIGGWQFNAITGWSEDALRRPVNEIVRLLDETDKVLNNLHKITNRDEKLNAVNKIRDQLIMAQPLFNKAFEAIKNDKEANDQLWRSQINELLHFVDTIKTNDVNAKIRIQKIIHGLNLNLKNLPQERDKKHILNAFKQDIKREIDFVNPVSSNTEILFPAVPKHVPTAPSEAPKQPAETPKIGIKNK